MKGSALFDTMSTGIAAQCEANLDSAREEAATIASEAIAKTAAQRESALSATQSEMSLLDERWRQKAEAEATKAALAMKKTAVNKVLGEVQDAIDRIVKGPTFPMVLDSLLAEVMAIAEDDVVVLAPEAQVEGVQQWLSSHGHGGLKVEGSAALRDGVAVQDPARTYRISNTLSGRYSRVELEIRKICMTGLFGEISKRDTATDGNS